MRVLVFWLVMVTGASAQYDLGDIFGEATVDTIDCQWVVRKCVVVQVPCPGYGAGSGISCAVLHTETKCTYEPLPDYNLTEVCDTTWCYSGSGRDSLPMVKCHFDTTWVKPRPVTKTEGSLLRGIEDTLRMPNGSVLYLRNGLDTGLVWRVQSDSLYIRDVRVVDDTP